MNLASRAFAWIRAVLIGLPEREDHLLPQRSRSASRSDPSLTPRCPSPEMWANFLASAAPHRSTHPRPHAEVPPITTDDINSTLVGAYLLTPEVRQYRRSAYQLTGAR